MKNIVIENKGFEFGDCVFRYPRFYDTFSIDLKENKSNYMFDSLDFKEVVEFITRVMIERLDSAYNEVSLGGSIISIAAGENNIQRKYRSIVLDTVSKILWRSDKNSIEFDKNSIMKFIITSNDGFAYLFSKLYQAIDKKIIIAYIKEAIDSISIEQKNLVLDLISLKMKYMGNRLNFSFASNDITKEVSVLVTPRVMLKGSYQPKKFPIVFNATSKNFGKEANALKDTFNYYIFNDKLFKNLIDNLNETIKDNRERVIIDYIFISLFGESVFK